MTSQTVDVQCLPDRIRFHVELNGDYVVNWPRIQKLAPPEAIAAVAAAYPPVEKPKEEQFNGIFAKIDRLYEGYGSEDEDEDEKEDGGSPKRGEQYDSEDSFINDEELDEYFEVDSIKPAYKGFYINRGGLEFLEEGSKEEKTSGGRTKTPLQVYSKRKRGKEDDASPPKKSKVSDDVSPPKKTKVADNVSPPKRAKVSDAKKTKVAEEVPKESKMVCRPTPKGLLKVKVELAAACREPVKEPLTERLTVQNNSEEPKEASPGRRSSKITSLDKAVQDLESGIAELCPPSTDGKQDTKGKRLPKELKARLAKVARLAQKQNRLTEEFQQGLIKMMGHLMQPKTVKKNIKDMVELGLTAQKEKQNKLDTIKLEVEDMVKERLSPHQQPDTASEADGTRKSDFAWDNATEDRIHDLYELYVEGLDEPKGASCKKFYAELLALWPEGYMDRTGIKSAVSRAKERRKGASKQQAKAEDKKRRPSRPAVKKEKCNGAAAAVENLNPTTEAQKVDDPSVCEMVLSSSSMRRDHPQEVEVVNLSSSLRQLSSRCSSCCYVDERPSTSPLWMINDPEQEV